MCYQQKANNFYTLLMPSRLACTSCISSIPYLNMYLMDAALIHVKNQWITNVNSWPTGTESSDSETNIKTSSNELQLPQEEFKISLQNAYLILSRQDSKTQCSQNLSSKRKQSSGYDIWQIKYSTTWTFRQEYLYPTVVSIYLKTLKYRYT